MVGTGHTILFFTLYTSLLYILVCMIHFTVKKVNKKNGKIGVPEKLNNFPKLIS